MTSDARGWLIAKHSEDGRWNAEDFAQEANAEKGEAAPRRPQEVDIGVTGLAVWALRRLLR